MIPDYMMSLEQEMVWRHVQTKLAQLRHRAQELLILVENDVITGREAVAEYIHINTEIDNCIEVLLSYGICDFMDKELWSIDLSLPTILKEIDD